MKESKVEEIHQNLEQEREKKKKSIVEKTPRKTRWWLALGAIVLIWYFYNRGGIGRDQIILFLIIAAVVYMLLQSEKTKAGLEIGEQEAKAALYAVLKWKQVNPYDDVYEIPPEAKIRIYGPAVLRYLEGKPWRWEVGYQVRLPNGLVKTYSGDVHPYTAKVVGIRRRRKGFSGLESPDIRYIKSPKTAAERRYKQAVEID